MLADDFNPVQSGQLDKDIHPVSTHNLELTGFIVTELPRWRDHPDRPKKDNETSLTEYLCDYLNGIANDSTAWSHVQFRTETGDEGRGGRKIDLTVKPRGCALIIEGRRHSQFDSLFPIECKRLPTPEGTGRDEREYVFTKNGTTGGVQRFKFGYHGSTHTFVAMIAYVQEQNCAYWLKEINGWIESLAAESDSEWTKEDLLRSLSDDSASGISVLQSNHIRPSGLSPCGVRHLWVKMD